MKRCPDGISAVVDFARSLDYRLICFRSIGLLMVSLPGLGHRYDQLAQYQTTFVVYYLTCADLPPATGHHHLPVTQAPADRWWTADSGRLIQGHIALL